MTVIIASREGIWADTGVYFGNNRSGPHLKVVRSTFRDLGPGWFAASGCLSSSAKLMRAAAHMGVGATTNDKDADAVFLSDKGILMENDEGAGWYEISPLTTFTYLGSGKAGAIALIGSGMGPLQALTALHKTFVFMDFPLQHVEPGDTSYWLFHQDAEGLVKQRRE